MAAFKSKETEELHRSGCIKRGKVKVCKGFGYMKLHDPERFMEISINAGKRPKNRYKRMNIYQIFSVIDVIRHDGVIDLPAIDIINKTIKALGYKGKFGLFNGRPAYTEEEEQ